MATLCTSTENSVHQHQSNSSVMPSTRFTVHSERVLLADKAYTFGETAKRVSVHPDLQRDWRGENEGLTQSEPWSVYMEQQSMCDLPNEAKLDLHHNITNQNTVRGTQCNASCQTPPEFFAEVHNAHLCSCDQPLDAASSSDPVSYAPSTDCPILEDLNQQFQPWLLQAHQLQAQHPDPFILFPQHAFKFWPYPGWTPKDDAVA